MVSGKIRLGVWDLNFRLPVACSGLGWRRDKPCVCVWGGGGRVKKHRCAGLLPDKPLSELMGRCSWVSDVCLAARCLLEWSLYLELQM